jgi:predicted acylesterase/phospholipase RssA/CRP-like cAMP-binding protein
MGEGQQAEPESLAELVSAAIPEFLTTIGSVPDKDLVSAVAAAVEPIRLRAGDTLFMETDEPDAVYFVITGRLLILTDDDQGNRVVIRRVGRGELVGEVSLIEGIPRTATVLADRDATLARMPRESFESLAAGHTGFLLGVTRTVVQRLAHPRPRVDAVGTIAVAVAHPDLDTRVFTSRLVQALETKGSVAHLTAASIAAVVGEDAEQVRIEQYLDEVETHRRFVLLETDRAITPWTKAALRRADRVVAIVKQGEESQGREFIDFGRTGHDPDLWMATERADDALPPHQSAALATQLGVDRVLHFRATSAAEIARVARLATGTGTGIVLGGGGARGFAHIGVYRALTELGVPVDAVAGASIGGIIGAGIATAPTPDEILELAKAGFSKVLDYTLPVVSMVKGSLITKEIDRVFAGMDIEDLALPFVCVSTNLTTAAEMIHDSGPVTVATRAGLAIPGVIPPVPHDGELLVDGGVLNNLPIGPLRATGLVDTVIAVDVAPRMGPRARADYGLSVSGWKALRSKLVRRRRVYPGISSVLLRSMIVGSMRQRDELLAAGMADLYLDLDLRGISLLAFDKVEAVATAGYEASYPMIEEWLKERVEGRVG